MTAGTALFCMSTLLSASLSVSTLLLLPVSGNLMRPYRAARAAAIPVKVKGALIPTESARIPPTAGPIKPPRSEAACRISSLTYHQVHFARIVHSLLPVAPAGKCSSHVADECNSTCQNDFAYLFIFTEIPYHASAVQITGLRGMPCMYGTALRALHLQCEKAL